MGFYYYDRSRAAMAARLGAYSDKVLSTGPIAYWPLSELTGTVAGCRVNPAQNGTYSGPTLGQPGIGDGNTCPLFDGVNDRVALYSAALASAFDGAKGSLLLWLKVSGAGVWADGSTDRVAVQISVDGGNELYVHKEDGADLDKMEFAYSSGGTQKTLLTASQSTVDWFSMGLVWSEVGDSLRYFLQGEELLPAASGLGTWAGSLADNDRSWIGSDDGASPNECWDGYIAHLALWDRVLTPATMADLAVL